jgi:hypothetical protein
MFKTLNVTMLAARVPIRSQRWTFPVRNHIWRRSIRLATLGRPCVRDERRL